MIYPGRLSYTRIDPARLAGAVGLSVFPAQLPAGLTLVPAAQTVECAFQPALERVHRPVSANAAAA